MEGAAGAKHGYVDSRFAMSIRTAADDVPERLDGMDGLRVSVEEEEIATVAAMRPDCVAGGAVPVCPMGGQLGADLRKLCHAPHF